jgi:ribosomal protein S18 acetylase RimI-like enzyme
MDIIIRRTDDIQGILAIARSLPEYFNAQGLASIEADAETCIRYGAYTGDTLVGFVIYKPHNAHTVEMAWLGVSPAAQGTGIGTTLVETTLEELRQEYKLCEVKTLAATDPYEPYKKTRAFYEGLGFLPIEIIAPYPGWGDDPCQIYIRALR